MTGSDLMKGVISIYALVIFFVLTISYIDKENRTSFQEQENIIIGFLNNLSLHRAIGEYFDGNFFRITTNDIDTRYIDIIYHNPNSGEKVNLTYQVRESYCMFNEMFFGCKNDEIINYWTQNYIESYVKKPIESYCFHFNSGIVLQVANIEEIKGHESNKISFKIVRVFFVGSEYSETFSDAYCTTLENISNNGIRVFSVDKK